MKSIRSTLKILPYYSYSGCLTEIHGQFNSSLSPTCKTKKELEKLTSLYDLDLFSLNTALDNNLNPVDYSANKITSRYFSPHSFKEMKTKLSKDEATSSFSVFHNNVASLNRNLENLQTQLLRELDFHFNVIGVTETKITNANSQLCTAHIPGYVFEYVPTPLASGGVGMFMDESLSYRVLERTSNEAFQVLWAEFSFENKKNVSTIQKNMDKRLFSCGIFIDLKKAFDTVDHKILLHKLYHYGFRGVINKWFSSYLDGRTQTTQIGSYVSKTQNITCGVPQGSVLGPLLFLIYINDIQESSNKLKLFLFADDTNAVYADKNLKSLEFTINQELCKLFDWLTANKLTLNIEKTTFVIFRPAQRKLNYHPKIMIFDNNQNKKCGSRM